MNACDAGRASGKGLVWKEFCARLTLFLMVLSFFGFHLSGCSKARVQPSPEAEYVERRLLEAAVLIRADLAALTRREEPPSREADRETVRGSLPEYSREAGKGAIFP
ncbi:MAG: hypothetical protein K5657_02935 [Desulfovibrio sp.]|nr:hypothetical protein [Desulfovibrio sp.]